MAIYSNTLSQLIEWTCRLVLHDWKEGTATGGSTSTVVDTSRDEAVDYFQNTTPVSKVYIRTTTDSAAPISEQRVATDFAVGVNPTITVSPNFTAAVGSGDTYAILSEYEWAEVRDAINMAIEMVAEESLFFVIDESTITLSASTYEYTLPTSFMYLYRVSMEDANGDFPEAIPPDQYKVIRSSAPELHLFRFPTGQAFLDHRYGELFGDSDIVADRDLRLEGLATPDKLSADTDTCPISPAYIIYQAGALLHQSRITRPESDYDYHRLQADLSQKRADIERVRVVSMNLPANSKRCRE